MLRSVVLPAPILPIMSIFRSSMSNRVFSIDAILYSADSSQNEAIVCGRYFAINVCVIGRAFDFGLCMKKLFIGLCVRLYLYLVFCICMYLYVCGSNINIKIYGVSIFIYILS